MNCEQIRAMYLAGEQDEVTRVHLADCAACRRIRAELEVGRTALTDSSIWEEPSPELEDQVVGLISGSRRRADVSRGRASRRLWPVAAAAAAIAAVVVVAGVRSPSPDWVVAMPGTQLAEQASSTVSGWNTDSGTRMILSIDGLERAPEGYVYEFWLSRGPLHISAGTFSAAGDIELWAGVTRADFPRLWVTLEPLDDDESPSQHTVLDTADA
jgi:hypothetical protein